MTPAPFRLTARDWAGPNPPALVLLEKFGQYQPLNLQVERDPRMSGVTLPSGMQRIISDDQAVAAKVASAKPSDQK